MRAIIKWIFMILRRQLKRELKVLALAAGFIGLCGVIEGIANLVIKHQAKESKTVWPCRFCKSWTVPHLLDVCDNCAKYERDDNGFIVVTECFACEQPCSKRVNDLSFCSESCEQRYEDDMLYAQEHDAEVERRMEQWYEERGASYGYSEEPF